ncbi:MAG: sodium:solute symporter [Rhodothermales bacterium]
MLTLLDYAVIAIYIVAVLGIGAWIGGRQTSRTDYFLGSRSLPWWAVCFSIVATETSTLTVIGVPAVAYAGAMTFLQLTLGYLIGRIAVSIVLLPRYVDGEFVTAYAFLGQRFGWRTQVLASITFLCTRLLADGVRLFATAIPIKLIAVQSGVEVSYLTIIAAIGVFTIIYTMIGGIKAVIWIDVIQMGVYVGGSILALLVLLDKAPAGWFQMASEAGKLKMLNFEAGRPLVEWITQPYAFFTAVVGGAIFTMASHGSDQLIVQRLLVCRNLADSRKALIGSGLVVMVQFALFLFVGVLIWVYYGGASVQELGLARADEVFPKFIIEGLPAGVSGLILAGIVAAAMSTLSSSLNALASSTMMDLYERFSGKALENQRALRVARMFTLIWGVIFVGFASLFEDQTSPVVELGLAIATFTYGGMLGLFALGLLQRRAVERDAIAAFVVTIALMVVIITGVRYDPATGWLIRWFSDAPAGNLVGIAWPWFTAIGAAMMLVFGSLRPLWHILWAPERT